MNRFRERPRWNDTWTVFHRDRFSVLWNFVRALRHPVRVKRLWKKPLGSKVVT